MKTTVELPDALFRKAKSAAAEQGQSLKEFLTEAVRRQLQRGVTKTPAEKPWAQAFGGLKDLHKENLRIQRVISAEFEGIDEDQWR